MEKVHRQIEKQIDREGREREKENEKARGGKGEKFRWNKRKTSWEKLHSAEVNNCGLRATKAAKFKSARQMNKKFQIEDTAAADQYQQVACGSCGFKFLLYIHLVKHLAPQR